MFLVVYIFIEVDVIVDYFYFFRRSEGLYFILFGEKNMEEDFLDVCEGREFELVSVFFGIEEFMIDDLIDCCFGW